MFPCVGLDIETNAKTGEPRLIGFAYEKRYHVITDPTLKDFFRVIKNLINNARGTQLAVWGSLDIQCILRLFDPNEQERRMISRGISGYFDKRAGKFRANPPIQRTIGKHIFFVDHYIAGRSLRLGIVSKHRAYSIWIYNLSQFFPKTIEQTALGLGFKWTKFAKNTHIVNWARFHKDEKYRTKCLASNKQDAKIVRKLAMYVQDMFNNVFGAYPSLLVSAGSLADGAVSKLLNDADYASNSWRWLSYNVWRDGDLVSKAETLLAETFSAGYVDQFAIGYFPEVFTADIASAYPDKIRKLPDLRTSELFAGSGDLDIKIRKLLRSGYRIVTAAIRGVVTIPEDLRYHPITVRTAKRQNIRPIGTFGAAYMLEERAFCRKYGAKFRDEEYVIFACRKMKLAPIAAVSNKLRELRDRFRDEMARTENSDRRLVLDGMQFFIKVVDNSLYGKTVMSTPIVENIDDRPQVTGFKAGDRYNMLYGSIITSRTRIQLAKACMEIDHNGGRVILTMTDSIDWIGEISNLSPDLIREEKTAGYFEPPERLTNFFLLKTGQYEFRENDGTWKHKLRGLNVPYEMRDSKSSFYRDIISKFCAKISTNTHPDEIEIPVPVRRLVTIGSHDLSKLGLIQDSRSYLRPFVMGDKTTVRFIHDWQKCLDGHIWFEPIVSVGSGNHLDTPLQFLRGLYESGADYLTRYQRKQLFYYECVLLTGFVMLPKRLTEMSWPELEGFFGKSRVSVIGTL